MARIRSALRIFAVPALLGIGGCALKPIPLDEAEIVSLTQTNTFQLASTIHPVHGAVSVYEAIARALKYNLDAQVESAQVSLRGAEIRQASAAMLPGLATTAGYSSRNHDVVTSSLDLPTGLELPATSVSQDRAFSTHDVTFSWNILDFALSYVRAKQAADLHLIALEARRKTIQRIVEDTRTAYWRAVSCDRLVRKLAKLEDRARKAIRGTRAAASGGAESPMTALTYERELVQIRQTTERLQHELNLAKSQLAALINLPPGTEFTLIETSDRLEMPVLDMSADEMVAEAIFNRSEIREIAYRQRITEREATAAILELLPSLRLNGSQSFNDDHFLLHNDWVGWGASAAGNLINVFQLPARHAAIEAQNSLLTQKALAVTMVVMTQVYVSRIRYRHFAEQLPTARDYRDVQTRLVQQLRLEKSADLIGEQTLIREEMNLIVAEAQYDIALGNLQNASSNLMTSMGFDPQGRDVDLSLDIGTLAEHVKANWSNHEAISDRGRYLFEQEKARQEVRRRQAEEERRRKEHQQRLADEAARNKAEQVKLAKAEAHRVHSEAKLIQETEARQRRAEAQRLKQEAESARAEARQARRRGVARKALEPSTPASQWQWVWPSDPEPEAGSRSLKDTSKPSRSRPAKKAEAVYSGTK